MDATDDQEGTISAPTARGAELSNLEEISSPYACFKTWDGRWAVGDHRTHELKVDASADERKMQIIATAMNIAYHAGIIEGLGHHLAHWMVRSEKW